MTLIGAILKKVQSTESVTKKYTSPPPEIDEVKFAVTKKKRVYKYSHVPALVDSSPPRLDPTYMYRTLPGWARNMRTLYVENMQLLMRIKRQNFLRGRVDRRWKELPPGSNQYYTNRVQILERVHKDNLYLNKRILASGARVATVASLQRDWSRNRREIEQRALTTFVLFPPVLGADIDDPAFALPPGVKRPRVHLTLGVRGGGTLGELVAELFQEVCPRTCQLFTELLDGDGLGHGYVGTCFFRKVPNLYWSGGDVIEDNGFGCYAQRGLQRPIGAENYHFPHSMAGLLSMRMTCDDEMCASFNITFKPLPQFDLHNVVFGRILRPSSTYSIIRELGSPLSAQPTVQICAARRRVEGRWVYGRPNTSIVARDEKLIRNIIKDTSIRYK